MHKTDYRLCLIISYVASLHIFCYAIYAAENRQYVVVQGIKWRFPDKSDIAGAWEKKEEWKYILGHISVAPYHVRGDFNGDNLQDDCWIMLNDDDNKWGLFVLLQKKSMDHYVFKVLEYSNIHSAQYYVISIAKPSKNAIITACGKGYYECSPSDPKKLTIKNDSIYFCLPESACQIITWNDDRNVFDLIQISD
ncbi:MAG: hypothetical protein OEV92_05510 [Nitrospinota bacterium]|nr:hypothetical protein [Nitrospinota bacterium]